MEAPQPLSDDPQHSVQLIDAQRLQPQDSVNRSSTETQNLLQAAQPSSSEKAATQDALDGGAIAAAWPAGDESGQSKRSWWDPVRIALAKRVTMRKSYAGTGSFMSGRSLGIFGIRNPWRTAVYRILFSQGYEYFLFCCTVAHVIITTFLSGRRDRGPVLFIRNTDFTALDALDYALSALYTLEMLLRIFALGLWRGPHTYLRSGYNRLDFALIGAIWGTKIVAWAGSSQPFRPAIFRGFRAVLCIRNVPTITGIVVTMEAIGISLRALVHVVNLFLIVFVVFILSGVSLYQQSFQRRCVLPQGPGVNAFSLSEPTWFCGSTNPLNHKDKGFLCPADQGQVCRGGLSNPDYGYQGFDNFAQNTLTVFQILTNEEWYTIMWDLLDSEFRYACAYFMAIIVIGTYFFWNVWLNAMLAIFMRLHKQDAVTRKIGAMRRQSLWRAVALPGTKPRPGTVQNRFGSVVDTVRQQAADAKAAAAWPAGAPATPLTEFGNSKEPLPLTEGAAKSPTSWLQWLPFKTTGLQRIGSVISDGVAPMVTSKWFEPVTFVFAVVNLGLLASYRYDNFPSTVRTIDRATQGFAWLFMVEVCVRIAYEGPRNYFSQATEVVDFVIVILSLAANVSGSLLNLNMVRLVRWLRVLTNTKAGQKTILYKMLASIPSVATFMSFFFIVVAIFSVLGLQLFGGRFNFVDGLPRANFDNFWQAFLTMFQVASQQNWPYVMYDSMRVAGKSAPIVALFYALYFLMTNFVILNLIVASVLEQFIVRDSEKRRLQRRRAIREAANKQVYRNWFIYKAERVRVRLLLYFKWIIFSEEEALAASPYLQHLLDMEATELALLTPAARAASMSGEAGCGVGALESRPSVLSRRTRATSVLGAGLLTSDSFTSALTTSVPADGEAAAGRGRTAMIMPAPLPAPEEAAGSALAIEPVLLEGAQPAASGVPEFENHPLAKSLSTLPEDMVAALRAQAAAAASDSESETPETSLKAGSEPSHQETAMRRSSLRKSVLGRSIDSRLTADPEAGVLSERLLASKPQHQTLTPRLAKHLFGPSYNFKKEDAVVIDAMHDMEWLAEEAGQKIPSWMDDRTLFLFGPRNKLRRAVKRAVAHRAYQLLCLAMVIVSILGNFWTPPVGKAFKKENTVKLINFATAGFFLIDLLLRAIADGLLLTPTAYLLKWYRILDLLILLIDGLVLLKFKPYITRAVRMAFSARAFRFVTLSKTMRRLAGALVQTLVPCLTVLCFCIVVCVMFAIAAMRFMGGKFFSCSDGAVLTCADCVGSFLNDAGVWAPRVWDKPNYNFDSFGKAMLSLFELTTMDNWPDFMHTGMDSAGVALQPVRDRSTSYSLFFVVFITVMAFWMIRAFTGVFIKQYMLITGEELLTEKQRTWRDMLRISKSFSPLALEARPVSRLQARCYDWIHWQHFPSLIVAVILLNTAFQMTTWASEPNGWHTALQAIDTVFVVFYTAEMAAKMLMGSSLRSWAINKWNLAEAVIVFGSWATLFADKGTGREVASRPFRFSRIIRIVRYVYGLQTLAATIMSALPATMQVAGIMGVTMCMYSGVGTQLFAFVRRGNGSGITRQVNFSSFGNTFLILFQIMTSEGWRDIMNDAKLKQPHCTPHPVGGVPSDCGFQVGATIYFCSFLVIASTIIMALFMAVAAEYVSYDLVVGDTAMISVPHLRHFQAKWAELDPSGSGFLRMWDLRQLVMRLGAPLGAQRPTPRYWRLLRWQAWELSAASPRGLPFHATLHLLLRTRLGLNALTYAERAQAELRLVEVARTGAVTYIQACLRGHNARKRVAAIRVLRAAGGGPLPPIPPFVERPMRQGQQQQESSNRGGGYFSMLPFSRLGPKLRGKGYFAF